MEATTRRASTVMRSMPTSETRTQASMTMPLSRTRSRTSMRLEPPDARSTGMFRSLAAAARALAGQLSRAGTGGERGELLLERRELLPQLTVLDVAAAPGRQEAILAPPIEADLLRLVHRAGAPPDA